MQLILSVKPVITDPFSSRKRSQHARQGYHRTLLRWCGSVDCLTARVPLMPSQKSLYLITAKYSVTVLKHEHSALRNMFDTSEESAWGKSQAKWWHQLFHDLICLKHGDTAQHLAESACKQHSWEIGNFSALTRGSWGCLYHDNHLGMAPK